MLKIKNINTFIHYNCVCGTWLKHWEKFSGKKAPLCAVPGCNTLGTNGAHVQKAESTDESWYVLPLCEQHGAIKNELEVSADYKLVPASTELTCERW